MSGRIEKAADGRDRVNIRLVVEYDGSGFLGFQKQSRGRTVQGELERAVCALFREPVRVLGAGRTDAGVHARGQVVNFHGAIKPRPERLPAALNAFLPHDIVVMKCEEVAEDFNARRSAVAREYRYFIHRGEFPWPFNRRYAHHYPGYLNEQAMEEALARIRGVHDFAAFARCEEGKTGVREVLEAEMRREEETLQIRVKANAFVWMMMRMLCGSLLEVGRGKWTAEHFAEVLDGRDNSASGPALPPRGSQLVFGHRLAIESLPLPLLALGLHWPTERRSSVLLPSPPSDPLSISDLWQQRLNSTGWWTI